MANYEYSPESMTQALKDLKSEVATKDHLYSIIAPIKSEMVTKSYLDSRLDSLRREILNALNREDSELRKIEGLVHK